MRLLNLRALQRLFEATDEIPPDREAPLLPLELTGEGAVERLPSAKVRITLPDSADLGPFLETLPERVRGLREG